MATITNKTKKQIAKDFLNKKWATIGGRIEEYAWVYENEGSRAARREIIRTYGMDGFKLVWTGLQVFMNLGLDAYYSKDRVRHIANN